MHWQALVLKTSPSKPSKGKGCFVIPDPRKLAPGFFMKLGAVSHNHFSPYGIQRLGEAPRVETGRRQNMFVSFVVLVPA